MLILISMLDGRGAVPPPCAEPNGICKRYRFAAGEGERKTGWSRHRSSDPNVSVTGAGAPRKRCSADDAMMIVVNDARVTNAVL